MWPVALGGATAVAVALRARRRTHGGPAEPRTPAVGASEAVRDPSERALVRQTWSLDDGPTGAPAMVVATMEAAPAPMGTRFGHNGSELAVAEREPTEGPPRQPLGPIELPPRRRLSGATLAGLGVVAGLAAIGLGTWAAAESVVSDDSGAPASIAVAQSVKQVVALMSRPKTATLPFEKSGGRILLVVGAEGTGVLVLKRLAPAPAGKTYEAWVGPNLGALEPAAVFSGTQPVVPLTAPVPSGAVVAMTLEHAGGAGAPSRTPKLVARRS